MDKKKKFERFFKKANAIHGDKYDYSKVHYINCKIFVIIICKVHGEFSQTPGGHIAGLGCRMCGLEISKNKQRKTTEEFVTLAKFVHGDRYDYSKTKYVNDRTKVEIVCPIHGSFWQLPANHTSKKRNCYKCGVEIISNKRTYTTDEFISRAKCIHGNKYDYSISQYAGCIKKVKILCRIHGKFEQFPDNHIHGKGCYKCSNNISKSETSFLNFLNITHRNIRFPKWRKKSVDGYDEKTNTVYEFLGDYWHGNPKKFNVSDINMRTHKPFGELYENTFKSFRKLKSLGYNVKYIWESDWKDFVNKTDKTPKILEY